VHRLTRQAEADLDDIWGYLAAESGSDEIADRQTDAITARFYLLANHSYAGRARDDDLGTGRRTFPVDRYIIVYTVARADVLILRVAHSGQDLKALMRRGSR
jgi:plasmid stabilization system protein ParE